ncbi:hypothetical protein JCM6882_006022 [Rhodosporidiobolus microsporus]
MSATDRFEPTLSGLPPKLKERILSFLDSEDLYADDDWEDDDDDATEKAASDDKDKDATVKDGEENDDEAIFVVELDPEELRKKTLSALSLVNKEWNGLVVTVLWRDLWLYPCSTEALLELVEEILPRHAKHVEQLIFRESPFDLLLEDGPTDELPPAEGRALEIVEAAERMGGVDASPTWDIRVLRARDLLLAQAVKACPGVKILDIEGPLRPLRVKQDDEDETAIVVQDAALSNAALEAVKSLGPAIETLSLLLPPDGVSTEADAAELLSAFSSLKRLEINSLVTLDDEKTKKDDRAALFSAFTSLTGLEELDLGQSSFVNDKFAALPLKASLKHLALGDYPDLSFPSFIALVKRFSETLESLELDDTPRDASDEETAAHLGKAVNLPKLVALEVATPHKTLFLDAFANSPLKEVFFGECPQFKAAEVVKFLEAHKDTLVDVDMEEGGIPDEENDGGEATSAEEVISAWCAEHDKNFAIMPLALETFSDDDSDDEDEDEEKAE